MLCIVNWKDIQRWDRVRVEGVIECVGEGSAIVIINNAHWNNYHSLSYSISNLETISYGPEIQLNYFQNPIF